MPQVKRVNSHQSQVYIDDVLVKGVQSMNYSKTKESEPIRKLGSYKQEDFILKADQPVNASIDFIVNDQILNRTGNYLNLLSSNESTLKLKDITSETTLSKANLTKFSLSFDVDSLAQGSYEYVCDSFSVDSSNELTNDDLNYDKIGVFRPQNIRLTTDFNEGVDTSSYQIQSVNLEVSISREPTIRVGQRGAVRRYPSLPLEGSMTISMLKNNVEDHLDLSNLVTEKGNFDFVVKGTAFSKDALAPNLNVKVYDCHLTSVNLDHSLDGNATINFSYSFPIANDAIEYKNSSFVDDISFTFIDTVDDNIGRKIQWRGCEVSPDGNTLYHIPYYKDYVLETDLTTDTCSQGADVTVFSAQSAGQKCVDCDIAPNGNIYANPHGLKGHLIIDTSDGSVSVVPIGYAMQLRGGAIVDGIMYSVTYSGTTNAIRFVNTNTDLYEPSFVYTVDTSGPFYTARPNWETEDGGGLGNYNRYWGAVDGGNGKVYGVPFSAERILIIETSTVASNRSAYQGSDTLTGNLPLPTGPAPLDTETPYLQKYTGGVLSSINNCIYCMPREANSILKIDPSDDSAVEIPLPENYPDNETDSKSLGTVEGPDGRIYGTLWQNENILWIDPINDQIGWINMSDKLSSIGATNNFYAYARTVGNSIYFSPAAAETVMKMTFNNLA